MEVKAVEQQALFHAFRELINELPYNFCMMWGFTGDAALLEAFVPQALLDRLSRSYIELQTMEVNEAKEFLKSQLAQFRPDAFKNKNAYHPFTEDTIELVLEHIVEMNPRKMFRMLRIVMERAIRRHNLQIGTEIDHDLTQEILEDAGL